MGTRMFFPLLTLIVLGYTITAITRIYDESMVDCTIWKGIEILGWALQNFKGRCLNITELWVV